MELLYAANPMCSWCWGFAPVMREVAEAKPDAKITAITGQLGHGPRAQAGEAGSAAASPMRQKDKDEVRRHWEHVQERSGQPFDFGFFERESFTYDTEPPCRALILVRSAYPALALPFLHRLHERFYAEGEDVTDAGVLADAAAEFGLERAKFLHDFDTEEAKRASRSEWDATARIGVTGYPTLLAMKQGRKPALLALGYRDADEVLAGLEEFEAEVA